MNTKASIRNVSAKKPGSTGYTVQEFDSPRSEHHKYAWVVNLGECKIRVESKNRLTKDEGIKEALEVQP